MLSNSREYEREAQERKREMRNEDMPWWLQGIDIVGFEDDESEDDDDGGDPDEDEEDEDSEDEDDDSEDQEDEDEEPDKNIQGLKKALQTERKQRKQLQRELKALKAQKGKNSSEESDEDDSTPSAEETARSEKLAQKLRDNTVETMIVRHAGNDFRDIEAVLKLINRDMIDVDQDDDDPSEIEVDEDSVKDAIKDLRKRHSYLVKPAEERSRSGSKFNGKKNKNTTLSDEALREKYAGLRT